MYWQPGMLLWVEAASAAGAHHLPEVIPEGMHVSRQTIVLLRATDVKQQLGKMEIYNVLYSSLGKKLDHIDNYNSTLLGQHARIHQELSTKSTEQVTMVKLWS